MFPLLKRNVSPFPNVRCVHGAVCASDQPVTYWEAELSCGGRIDTSGTDEVPDWVVGQHTVPALLLDDLLDEPTDLLKMDIEGAEYEVLPSSARLGSVPALTGELHGVPGHPPTDEILATLRRTHDVRITSPLAGPNITFDAALSASRAPA